jgi:hypothetical protein
VADRRVDRYALHERILVLREKVSTVLLPLTLGVGKGWVAKRKGELGSEERKEELEGGMTKSGTGVTWHTGVE